MKAGEIFESIKQYLLERGIPENDQDVIKAVTDVTGEDASTLMPNTTLNTRFADQRPVFTAYEKHRTDHNMGRAGNQIGHNQGFYFMGRQTTTAPSEAFRAWADVAYTIRGFRDEGAVFGADILKRFPTVISEVRTVDKTPANVIEMGDDIIPHLHIQLTNLEGSRDIYEGEGAVPMRGVQWTAMGDEARNYPGQFHFNFEKHAEIHKDLFEALEADGWTLIKRNFIRRNANRDLVEVTIGALPPDTLPGYQFQVVSFINCALYMMMGSFISELLIEAARRAVTVGAGGKEITEVGRLAFGIIMQAKAATAGVDARIRDLSARLKQNERNADQYRNTLAATMRLLVDEKKELDVTRRGAKKLAIDSVMEILELDGMVDRFKPLQKLDMYTDNAKMGFKFTTHAYGMKMHVRAHDEYYDDEDNIITPEEDETFIIKVEPLEVSVDVTATSWSSAIRMKGANGECLHPHIRQRGTDPCWGAAAQPISECWAKRDWQAMIRVICAWFTQWDEHEEFPATNPALLKQECEHIETTGWLIPKPEEVEVVEAAAEELEAELENPPVATPVA